MSEQSNIPAANLFDNAIEVLSESPVLSELVDYLWPNLILCTKVLNKGNKLNKKFKEFHDFREKFSNITMHKYLRLSQARGFSVIKFELLIENFSFAKNKEDLIKLFSKNAETKHEFLRFLEDEAMFNNCWQAIYPTLKKHIFKTLRKVNDVKAIDFYGAKLRKILLSSGIKNKRIISLRLSGYNRLDGVVLDKNTQVLDFITTYPMASQHLSIIELAKIIIKHKVQLLVISNFSNWRFLDKLTENLANYYPDLALDKMIVSDAGAQGFDAKLAAKYTKNDSFIYDSPLLQALFIAKCAISPLEELKHIPPKSIILDPFQSQVNQVELIEKFKQVIEECVSKVDNFKHTTEQKMRQENPKHHKTSKRHHEGAVKADKTILNTKMRDALQKLNYGGKS